MSGAAHIANLRILLYSHDTLGLGHTRRCQAIACGLAGALIDPAILMVSGARQSTMFDIPKCVDFVTIPSLKKSANGVYVARNVGLYMSEAMNLRSEILRSVVQTFRPDVLIVDKVPRGVYGELEPALDAIRANLRAIEPYLEEYFFDQPEQLAAFRWARVRDALAPN